MQSGDACPINILSILLDDFSLLENFKFRKLETRLAEYLINHLPKADLTEAVINITHERLVSKLGSAREVISRLLRDFERMGVVDRARRRIYINNRQALQNIVKV